MMRPVDFCIISDLTGVTAITSYRGHVVIPMKIVNKINANFGTTWNQLWKWSDLWSAHAKLCVHQLRFNCKSLKHWRNHWNTTSLLCRRLREKLLHFYERKTGEEYAADEWKVVKEFARSAAGVRSPTAKDIRTPAALKRTIEYLLTFVVPDKRRPFNVAYDFIFDRLRAVRQEIVIQNLSETKTVELLEPICMFLAYSFYRFVILIHIFILLGFSFILLGLLDLLKSRSINSIRKFADSTCRNV